MRRSVYNHNMAALSMTAKARTATENGVAVDRMSPGLSAFRSAMLVVNVGTITDGTHAFKIQESEDNSNWTDAAAADLQGSAISAGSASDERVYELGYVGAARYLRCVATVTGSPATGGVYSASFILGSPRRSPIPRS